jgi:RHS repeat-associated protein
VFVREQYQPNNLFAIEGTFLSAQNSAKPYRYGFQGQENDDEIKGSGNSYTTEFRQYDPRVGRWLSLDPLMNMFPDMSPYNSFANNPIYFTDPTGLAPQGDYYSKSGNYLGTDGKDDNKVYVADGVVEHENKVIKAFGSKELSIGHDEFSTISAIVEHEAGTSDSDESLWIAHTSNNAATNSNTSLYKKLMSGYSSAPDKVKVPMKTSDDSPEAKAARHGVIDVLLGGEDPTGGASLWDGTDFIAWGLNSPYGDKPHAKFRQYKSVYISGDIYQDYMMASLKKYPSGKVRYSGKYYNIPADVFSDRNHITSLLFSNWTESGDFYYNTGYNRRQGIEATGAKGHSIFWKKTP